MVSRRDQTKSYLNEESGFDEKLLHNLEVILLNFIITFMNIEWL